MVPVPTWREPMKGWLIPTALAVNMSLWLSSCILARYPKCYFVYRKKYGLTLTSLVSSFRRPSSFAHSLADHIGTFCSLFCNTSMSASSLPSTVQSDGYQSKCAALSDLSSSDTSISVQQSPLTSTSDLSSNKQISKNSLQLTRSLNSLNAPANPSRRSPYISTMNGRRHIRPPASMSPLSGRDHKIMEGSLYKQLLAKGVTEDVAYERQRMYNGLNSIVNSCNDIDLED